MNLASFALAGHLCLAVCSVLPTIQASLSTSDLIGYQIRGSQVAADRHLADVVSHSLVCGNPRGGGQCKVDGKFMPLIEGDDSDVHKVRCCSDSSLTWVSARDNSDWGCPNGVYGASRVPVEGCTAGTFQEAKEICESGGARLCTADEVLSKCTQATGCGYDNNYVWTSTEYLPPPPIEQFEGEHWVACGNPNGGGNCKKDGRFHPTIPSQDMDEHEIRCCSDSPLNWRGAVENDDKGCPEGVFGGSSIPNYGTSGIGSCLKGTFGEAKAYCERGGARLCTQDEVLDSCTQGSGCGYDGHFVWTSTEYEESPPIVQTNETFWVACGNPNAGSNCKVDGRFQSAMGAAGLQTHEIRCCSDSPLDWIRAMQNEDKGCPDVFGGSNIPFIGTSGPGACRVGTYAEAEAYCSGAGARLCTQEEVLDRCTENSGCSYDNEYIWTSSTYEPPPPIVQTNETYTVACGRPSGGTNCKIDGAFHPTVAAPGLEVHEIRCCSDTPLDWRKAVANDGMGCPAGVYGGSYIPSPFSNGCGYCRVGTYAEAEAYCKTAGARLCTQDEALSNCAASSGCSYDNEYIWTSSLYEPPPPIEQTDEDFWLVCGNPKGGTNCKDLNGDLSPAISGRGLEIHEVRCCSDSPLSWVAAKENDEKGCPAGVWGGSNIPNFGISGAGQCRMGTYGEAEAFCERAGARLCTFSEVMNQCTVATGCSYDNEYIWTSSPYEEEDIPEYDGEHWMVCGNAYARSAEGCKDENGDFHITYQANDREGHEVRCCSDSPLDWQGAVQNEDTCPGVWSASYIPLYKDVAHGKCFHNATYGEAKYYCELNGARLCTQIEVANGCTTGSGCAHDGDWIWTSTEVTEETAIERSSGSHTVACGNPNAVTAEGCMDNGEFFHTFPADDGESHEVRCCSETELPFFEFTSRPRKNEGCSVWSISELPAIPGSNGPFQCYHAASHWEAEAICSLNGARLCTDLEVVRGCSRGSGCLHDREWIWTATPSCSSDEECAALAHEDDYRGCFKDVTREQLLEFKVGTPFSIDACYESCHTAGYAYYGLKNGDTCFCGDSLGLADPVGDEKCSKACKMGPGKCGGPADISVFETGLAPTGTYNYEKEYIGCFKDKENVLSARLGTGYSIRECVDACSDADYALASISEGDLCQCGNEALNVKSLCLQSCSNGKGLCGGAGVTGNSIYKNKYGKQITQSLLECKGARASWWGDPHFITFDKLKYNCQGFGHFILAQCDDYMIQGLFKSRGVQGSKATVTDGIAAQYKDYPTVQVNFAMFESELTNYIEDKAVHIFVGNELVNQTETMHDEIDIQIRGIYIEIQFPENGPSIRIKIRSPRSGVMDVDICVPQECAGSTIGMLGTPNGDKSDDWMTRSGEVIFPLPSDYVSRGGYEYCTTEWCVETEEASLFTYGGDKTFEDFYGCASDFPGEIIIEDLPPDVTALCAGLDNEEECLEELAIAEDDEDETIDDILDNNNDLPDIDDTEDPDEDTPPECPEDLKLIGQIGTGFEKWPVQIKDRNGTSVTLKIKSPLLTPKTIQSYHVNYMTGMAHDLKCDGFEDIDGFFQDEITIDCMHSTPFAYFQIFSTDPVSYLEPGNDAVIPECCHPDESLEGVPGVAYSFTVACEPQCPENIA